MTSLFERYTNGEHVAVWDELHALPDVGALEATVRSDVERVVGETIERALKNLHAIAHSLTQRGYIFEIPEYSHPSVEETSGLAATLEERVGSVPASISSWLAKVGNVTFRGRFRDDDPAADQNEMVLDPFEFLSSSESVAGDLEDWNESARDQRASRPFGVAFAGDTYHKNDVSGGEASKIILPSTTIDAYILEDAAQRPWSDEKLWFVDYIRTYFKGRGFRVTRASLCASVDDTIVSGMEEMLEL